MWLLVFLVNSYVVTLINFLLELNVLKGQSFLGKKMLITNFLPLPSSSSSILFLLLLLLLFSFVFGRA